ncbi:hypothetical protein ACFYOV_28605 [Streptomyces sp. NPDC005931]|uniref:hypothetical protein n=1 Tax=Streptomyces sp. NPDC005931 TaxID=3364737 RepID=UPI00367B4417
MGADLRPGILTGLLDLLCVLDIELTGRLGSALLSFGFRELAGGELFQQLGDGGAALFGKDPQPVAHFLAGGVCGGGGYFGVVTSFAYPLHPIAGVLGGPTLTHWTAT